MIHSLIKLNTTVGKAVYVVPSNLCYASPKTGNLVDLHFSNGDILEVTVSEAKKLVFKNRL